jgi:hypothetical protein
MWEKEDDRLLALAIAVALVTENNTAQEVSLVKGTICNNKIQNMIVVNVFGTGEQIALAKVKNMKTNLNDNMMNLNELPAGTYVEAEFEESSDGIFELTRINTDNNKTVINFKEINKTDIKRVSRILKNIKGVNNFMFSNSTLQLYIEFNNEIINYKNLLKIIDREGNKIEMQ